MDWIWFKLLGLVGSAIVGLVAAWKSIAYLLKHIRKFIKWAEQGEKNEEDIKEMKAKLQHQFKEQNDKNTDVHDRLLVLETEVKHLSTQVATINDNINRLVDKLL